MPGSLPLGGALNVDGPLETGARVRCAMAVRHVWYATCTWAHPIDYAYAAPTIIFLIRMCGDPCEMLLVCVGCPLASPPVPNIFHVSWLPIRSRFAQKSVVIAL